MTKKWRRDNKMEDVIFNPGEQAILRHTKKLFEYEYAKHVFLKYLFEFSPTNTVIAGGVFTSIINAETINDIDVFLLDYPNTKAWKSFFDSHRSIVTNSSIDNPHDWRIAVDNSIDFLFSSSAHTTTSHAMEVDYCGQPGMNIPLLTLATPFFPNIQVIISKHKTRQELVKNFDFKHCCVSYDNNKMYLNRDTYRAIRNKELIKNTTEMARPERIKKFKDRGFSYCT